MIDQLDLLDTRPRWERLVPIAIARLQHYSTLAVANGMGPLIVTYSGGKDSDACLALVKESGVPYEAVYHWTTIDPPEVVAHIRTHPEVRFERPKRSFYQLVRKKGLPSAVRRWCCQALKERKYPGRIVVTGVRWAESARRSTRQAFEASRGCKTQKFLHAIIEWRLEDVWGYLEDRGVEQCSLYAEGFERLGCVCCPLGWKHNEAEARRWPKIVNAIKRNFDLYCAENPGRIDDPEKMWGRYLKGHLGRRYGKPTSCPLFADFRDGEEA